MAPVFDFAALSGSKRGTLPILGLIYVTVFVARFDFRVWLNQSVLYLALPQEHPDGVRMEHDAGLLKGLFNPRQRVLAVAARARRNLPHPLKVTQPIPMHAGSGGKLGLMPA